jgi:uncharacterized protein YbjQ (UPF0145 family)
MKWLSAAAVLVALAMPGKAMARDTRYLLAIQDVLTMPEAAGRLDQNFRFYFGNKKAGGGVNRGEVVANAKTNAANKSDEVACRWAMLSALVELQQKAKRVGADTVMGVESFYKKIPFVSDTEFECHAGAVMAGVALRGQAVKTH